VQPLPVAQSWAEEPTERMRRLRVRNPNNTANSKLETLVQGWPGRAQELSAETRQLWVCNLGSDMRRLNAVVTSGGAGPGGPGGGACCEDAAVGVQSGAGRPAGGANDNSIVFSFWTLRAGQAWRMNCVRRRGGCGCGTWGATIGWWRTGRGRRGTPFWRRRSSRPSWTRHCTWSPTCGCRRVSDPHLECMIAIVFQPIIQFWLLLAARHPCLAGSGAAAVLKAPLHLSGVLRDSLRQRPAHELQWKLCISVMCQMNQNRYCAGTGDKIILREALWQLGLPRAAGRVKRAIQFGTRISNQANRRDFGSNRAANLKNAGSVRLADVPSRQLKSR